MSTSDYNSRLLSHISATKQANATLRTEKNNKHHTHRVDRTTNAHAKVLPVFDLPTTQPTTHGSRTAHRTDKRPTDTWTADVLVGTSTRQHQGGYQPQARTSSPTNPSRSHRTNSRSKEPPSGSRTKSPKGLSRSEILAQHAKDQQAPHHLLRAPTAEQDIRRRVLRTAVSVAAHEVERKQQQKSTAASAAAALKQFAASQLHTPETADASSSLMFSFDSYGTQAKTPEKPLKSGGGLAAHEHDTDIVYSPFATMEPDNTAATRPQAHTKLFASCTLPKLIREGDIIEPTVDWMAGLSQTEIEVLRLDYQWWTVAQTPYEDEILLSSTRWFKIPSEVVAKKIRVKVSSVIGDCIEAQSSSTVRVCDPTISNLRFAGKLECGHKITCEFDYIGGDPGPHRSKWFRNQTPIRAANDKMQYEIQPEDDNCRITVEIQPLRSDGKAGLPVSYTSDLVFGLKPSAQSITIAGEPAVGNTLAVQVNEPRHEQKASIIRWFVYDNVDSIADKQFVTRENTFTLKPEEENKMIMAQYTPVSSGGSMGDPVFAVYGPIDAGGLPEADLVVEGEPMEGCTLVCRLLTSFNAEGEPEIKWLRGHRCVAKDQNSYSLHEPDIGLPIICEYTPISRLKVRGATVRRSTRPINPMPPTVSDLSIDGDLITDTVVTASYTYKGGSEGISRIKWVRISPEGWTSQLTEFKNQPTIRLSKDDLGCQIKVTVTAKRRDLMKEGNTAVYITPGRVRRGPPKVVSHLLEGIPMEGEPLHANVNVEYYGKQGTFQVTWFSGKTIIETDSLTYLPKHQDVGKQISYQFVPISANKKLSGPMVSDTSAPIEPGPPKIIFIQFDALYCCLDIKCMYEYVGGEEGKTELVWYRAPTGNAADWAKVYESKRTADTMKDYNIYHSTADDLNHFIKVEVTPYRVDRKHGPVTTFVGRLSLAPSFKTELQDVLAEGYKGFNVECNQFGRVQILMTHKALEIVRVDETRKRETQTKWSKEVGIVLSETDPTGFQITMNRKHTLDFVIGRHDARNLLTLIFRCFHAMGMHELALITMGKEVATEWRKGRFASSSTKEKAQTRLMKSVVNRTVYAADPHTPLSRVEIDRLERDIRENSLSWWLAKITLESLLKDDQ